MGDHGRMAGRDVQPETFLTIDLGHALGQRPGGHTGRGECPGERGYAALHLFVGRVLSERIVQYWQSNQLYGGRAH